MNRKICLMYVGALKGLKMLAVGDFAREALGAAIDLMLAKAKELEEKQ